MAKTRQSLRVLIGGPSDVNREAIRSAVIRWNELFSEVLGITLEPRMDTHDVSPALGASAQSIVNNQLVDKADLLIATFWTRGGTPTKTAMSGTLEEIQRLVDRGDGVRVMVYRLRTPVDPSAMDITQLTRMQDIYRSLQSSGYIVDVDSMDQLCERLLKDLTSKVQQLSESSTPPPVVPPSIFTQTVAEAQRCNADGYWFNIILGWDVPFLAFNTTLNQQQERWAQGVWSSIAPIGRSVFSWDRHITTKRVLLTAKVNNHVVFQYDACIDGVVRIGFVGNESMVPLRWLWLIIRVTREALQYFPQLTVPAVPLQHLGLVFSNGPDGGITTDLLFATESTRTHHSGFSGELVREFLGPETWVHAAKEFSATLLGDEGYQHYEEPLQRINFDMVTGLNFPWSFLKGRFS
jgi:hypothetical protein